MLIPTFKVTLPHTIIAGTVGIGRFDGVKDCLVAASNNGKVFLFNAQKKLDISGNNEKTEVLNFNEHITALNVAEFAERSVIFIGSKNSLTAYDAAANVSLFYCSVDEGVNCICVGRLGEAANELVFVGGDCTIKGFDKEGNDVFYTTTGDEARSLLLNDIDLDGRNELIVGSDDFALRIFKEDAIVDDIDEAAGITQLITMKDGRFAYGLENGTVGKYQEKERYWRIKLPHKPTSIVYTEEGKDGFLFVGWSNGLFAVYNDTTGETDFQHQFASSIAGIVLGDLSCCGKRHVIVATSEGQVHGYKFEIDNKEVEKSRKIEQEQENMRQLAQKKLALETEIEHKIQTEALKKHIEEGDERYPVEAIPSETDLKMSLNIDPQHACIILDIRTNNQIPIRNVVVFAEGIFDGESYFVHPPLSHVSDRIIVPMKPLKDVACNCFVKVMAGYPTAETLHILEEKLSLPKFSMYQKVASVSKPPRGSVRFKLKERIERIVLWFSGNFIIGPKDVLKSETEERLQVTFQSIRDCSVFVFVMDPSGKVVLFSDTIDTAAEIINSLASYLSLSDLQVSSDFPQQLEEFKATMNQFQEFKLSESKLTVDVADHANAIKALLIRAEDYRLMEDMKMCRKTFSDLETMNSDILRSYKIRCNNHAEMMKKLKAINQFIQKVASLRVGRFKNQLISACRDAIKSNDNERLFRAIQTGAAADT